MVQISTVSKGSLRVPGNIKLVLVLYNAALNEAIGVVRIYSVQKLRDERRKKKRMKGKKKERQRDRQCKLQKEDLIFVQLLSTDILPPTPTGAGLLYTSALPVH